MRMDIFTKLKRFDAYPKTLEDFRVRTFSGAAGNFFFFFLISLFVLFYYCIYFNTQQKNFKTSINY